MLVLVSLIGEQPIPNLLPLKHLKPGASLVVHSDFTRKATSCLETLIDAEVEFWPLAVDAPVVRMRPVAGAVPPRFEAAEIINLQAVREEARKER